MPAARSPAEAERTPPHDLAAEQCVLGGMLLSKDAVADVVEIVRSGDFYRPIHATIFDAVLDLYGRGEPADPITVAAALADSGDLGRVGGAPYLHTLIESVPTAANAAYYARIVAERAILRRLVQAGTRIVQLGHGAAAGVGRDADDVVDLAQQEIYSVTERRVSEGFAALADLMQPTLDEIEAVGGHGGVMTGVPTGFTDLDRLLNGLHPGQLVIVAGRPGLGKALALDTPLPTPDGWTTMGAVGVGDLLLDAAGRPTRVSDVSEIMVGRPCFEVEFCDGSVIVADAAHRWLTHISHSRWYGRGPRVVTTEEIRATLRAGGVAGRLDHAVTNAEPLSLPERDLVIPPYTFGVWLGAGECGSARFTTDDPALIPHVEDDGFLARPSGRRTYTIEPLRPCAGRPGSFTGLLDAAGVLPDKHIPAAYLRASQAQRRALLTGLMDAAGWTTRTGTVRCRAASRRLAEDIYELVVGLGYRCTVTRRPATARTADTSDTSAVYILTVPAADDVFGLEHKRLAYKQRRRPALAALAGSRLVVDVRPVASVPVRCVSVDNAEHLYLAGRSMIPTHNSTAAMDFTRSASVKHNLASAIFSLEMSKVEIVMRLLAAESRVPLHVLRSGQLSDDDWTKLARRMGEISEAPLFVDDTPNMTLMEIRAKARRLRQRHDLKLIVVDYLQLMTSPKRTESRQQEVAELSRGLKLLAKEVDCPVVAVSQLNRGPEQRTDKRPQLSDLRESGCLTADTALLRADTGTLVTFEALMRDGHAGVLVWSVDEHRRLVPAPLINVFASGTKQTYVLTLASGRTVKASANHRFLAPQGWTALCHLAPGDQLGVPSWMPLPTTAGAAQASPIAPVDDVAVVWDRVTSIEPLGPLPLYDATVQGNHSFIADGIVAHNSIEQDADVVILLHRDDYYDRDSPRAGEADFVVAKHRNGPTDTVTVAAQLHLSRFVDLAVT